MAAPSPRLPVLDAVRGAALVAMFGYHLVWDLAYHRLIDGRFPETTPFKVYGHAIASVFFLLAGAGLALAFRKSDPWPAYWRRLGLIAAAAAAISLATWWLFPDDFIYFGILHCIAAGSVLALPFLYAPLWLTGAAMAAAFALPLAVALPALDAAPFWWLGLGTRLHQSVDVRPLFPWLGMMLAGVIAARLGWLPGWTGTPSKPVAALALAGRHSLAIYLLHQPVFLGVLALVAALAPAPPARDFAGQCRADCESGGNAPAYCAAGCGCVVEGLKREALWDHAQAGRLSPAQAGRMGELALQCRAAAR